MRQFRLVAALGLLLTCTVGTLLAASPERLLTGFSKIQLVISTNARGCILFDVYVAQTPEQRSQGLMRIEKMDEYEGMIFLYDRSTEISMWMKNTLIPLDMLFLNSNAVITSIHTHAVPMSEDIISSGQPAAAVIELNGGAAERFGIAPGDRVLFPTR